MESIVRFESGGKALFGMYHTPAADVRRGVGVLFLEGWSGYRIGPHRMFVRAARRLAADGYDCLRFDFRGRGDSEGAVGEASIGTMVEDATAAIAFMLARSVGRIALLGMCSGTKVAMGACRASPSVDALVLWSAQFMGADARKAEVRKSRSALRTYARKLVSASTWSKLLRGRLNPGLIAKAIRGTPAPSDVEKEQDRHILETVAAFRGRALFVQGSQDPETAPAMAHFSALFGGAGIPVRFHAVQDANHNFYSLDWEKELFDVTHEWLKLG